MSHMREPTSVSSGVSISRISCASWRSMPAHEPDAEMIGASRLTLRRSFVSFETYLRASLYRPLDCRARPQHPCLGTRTS